MIFQNTYSRASDLKFCVFGTLLDYDRFSVFPDIKTTTISKSTNTVKRFRFDYLRDVTMKSLISAMSFGWSNQKKDKIIGGNELQI